MSGCHVSSSIVIGTTSFPVVVFAGLGAVPDVPAGGAAARPLPKAATATVRAALGSIGLSFPSGRVQIQVDGPGELDAAQVALPAAFALLGAMNVLPAAVIGRFSVFGTLIPDGSIAPAPEAAQAASQAVARGLGFICAASQGNFGAEAGCVDVLPAPDLLSVVNDFRGLQRISRPWQSWPSSDAAPRGLSEPAAATFDAGAGRTDPLPGHSGDWDEKVGSWWTRLFGERRAAVADRPDGPNHSRGLSDAGADLTMESVALAPGQQPAALTFATLGPVGHRARMRERVLERGTDSLADYELLEMLLFFAFKTGDTKPLAKGLINRFGSFARILTAAPEELLATNGLGPHSVVALQLVRAAAVRLARAEVQEQPILGTGEKLTEYLNIVLARERVEQFRVLFLDPRNRLIADEIQGSGTVNHVPAYPREIVKRALELHSSAIILVHNHPSGDPTPSLDDIEMTREIKLAAGLLSIRVHDHIIVGNGKSTSLRQAGLL